MPLSLGSIIFADAQLPALPSGRHLSLIEGRSFFEERTQQQGRGEALRDTADGELLSDTADGELLSDTADGELLSVGGSIWPCAAALCRWLLQNEPVVRGARVLELGAGTGACGLFAAGLGSAHVLLTDGRDGLVALQAANLKANAGFSLAEDASVSMQAFRWGQSAPPAGSWDLVLGSDTTYDGDVAEELSLTLGALLHEAEGTPPRVILSHDHRMRDHAVDESAPWDEDDGNLQSFLLSTQMAGLRVERLGHEQPTAAERASGRHDISIMEVTSARRSGRRRSRSW